MVGTKKQLHDNLCMAISGGEGGPCGCALAGSSSAAINFRCDLVPPTPCLVSCQNTLGGKSCIGKNFRGFIEINITKMEEKKEMLNSNVVGNSVSQCSRCNELEERCKKAEVSCVELEIEFLKKKEHCDELVAKVMALEGEKFEFEDKLKFLSEELERLKEVSCGKAGEIKVIANLTEDNEPVQLLIENKVLQCEKIRAESEVEVWKDKYQKLESWAFQLGMGRGGYEENGKKLENKPINNEGNLHLDTSFGFWQNLEKVVALGNRKIGDMQSAGNNLGTQWKHGIIAFVCLFFW
ncbi:unnamed protein product [Sphenostylis stenocarpa]|uniref:Uncharacterized protein n=1 Tax=Sphenostylis stenocarpa TaxID=92480 RepID=A0AA86STE0_9FABA|nr:unnamed protein product [Sphenostylis stenocarpa]